MGESTNPPLSVQFDRRMRLVFQLAEAAMPRTLFQGVLERIGRLSPAPG